MAIVQVVQPGGNLRDRLNFLGVHSNGRRPLLHRKESGVLVYRRRNAGTKPDAPDRHQERDGSELGEPECELPGLSVFGTQARLQEGPAEIVRDQHPEGQRRKCQNEQGLSPEPVTRYASYRATEQRVGETKRSRRPKGARQSDRIGWYIDGVGVWRRRLSPKSDR